MIYNVNSNYNGNRDIYKYESYLPLLDVVKFHIYAAFECRDFNPNNTQINVNIKMPVGAYIYLFDGVSYLEMEIKKCNENTK